MEAEGIEEGYTPLEERESPEPKKKRKTEVFQKLPSSSTVGLDLEVVEELQTAYEVLQTLMNISKIEAFLVKPNSDLYGMSAYYDIVKKPMWLNEVNRKLMDREYGGIKEVIADIKLLLENCYRFWGPSHRVTKKGLHIEHKLEQKLEELPITLKTKCLETEGPVVVVKTEDNEDEEPEVNEKLSENEYNYYTTYKGFQSKILNKVLSSDQDDLYSEENLEEQKKREQMMLTWERECLVDEKTEYQIKHMPQLAEIGQFLKLTYGVLNVEEMTQYEVERMLLMPKESTSLATLMTSMLSSAFLRSNLDATPIMPYEVWTAKLKKKVEDWLKVFYTTGDTISALNINGIEPYFWDVIAIVNPLEEKSFHEIPFYERVWIVKSLCDNLLHTNKTVQNVFMDETRAIEFRSVDFGRGPAGSYYFGLEFFPEIRIYKQNKVLDKVWTRWNKAEAGIVRLSRSNFLPQWNEDESRVEFLPNTKFFSIEADSVDSLKSLIENSTLKKHKKLTDNLNVYLNKARKHKCRLEGLEALYKQWHDYQNRAPEYFTNLLNLWLSTENPSYPKKDDDYHQVLGKRRSTTKTSIFFTSSVIESSEESSEELFECDVSDWEEEAVSRKNRKKKNSNNKRKKIKSGDVANYGDPINDSLRNTDEGQKLAKSTNNTVTKLPPTTDKKPTINVKPLVEIKKEPDDVIMISSDEEDLIIMASKTVPTPKPEPPLTIPSPSVTNPTSHSPGTKTLSFTSPPEPSRKVPVPLPMPVIEEPVVMPKPIQEMIKTPRKRPVPRPIQEPPPPPSPKTVSPIRTPPRQGWGLLGTTNPKNRSPVPMPISPRQMSPMNPRMMTPPGSGNMMRPGNNNIRASTVSMVQRNLFPTSPVNSAVPSIEGTLHIGPKSDGSYGYHVRLPDGGVINMSREDIEILKQRNNGNLPTIVKVPLIRQNNRVAF